MKSTFLTALLSSFFFVAQAQIHFVPQTKMVLLETPEDHPMVNFVTSTMREVILNVDRDVKVKFNNLFPVDFYKSIDNDPNRLYFRIYRGSNDIREGMVRIRGNEVSLMTKTYDNDGNVIWSGTRRLEVDASEEDEQRDGGKF